MEAEEKARCKGGATISLAGDGSHAAVFAQEGVSIVTSRLVTAEVQIVAVIMAKSAARGLGISGAMITERHGRRFETEESASCFSDSTRKGSPSGT